MNRDKRAAKQMAILVSCFGFCWLPYTTAALVNSFCHSKSFLNFRTMGQNPVVSRHLIIHSLTSSGVNGWESGPVLFLGCSEPLWGKSMPEKGLSTDLYSETEMSNHFITLAIDKTSMSANRFEITRSSENIAIFRYDYRKIPNKRPGRF